MGAGEAIHPDHLSHTMGGHRKATASTGRNRKEQNRSHANRTRT